jgi:hypothetical protein
MSNSKNILDNINPIYFWDIDFLHLDIDKSARIIIERVFSLGTMDEINELVFFYGKHKVSEILTGLNYIDPKTMNFASKFLGIPRKKFKCYTQKPSTPELWNS